MATYIVDSDSLVRNMSDFSIKYDISD